MNGVHQYSVHSGNATAVLLSIVFTNTFLQKMVIFISL